MNRSTTPYICKRCIHSLTRKPGAIPNSRSSLLQHRRYTSKPIPKDGRPFRMAIIGSGPAGFYTAYKVMTKIENAKIDMYEHLPTPFGLVRYGVAPDHPEVKNCQEKFQEVAESPNFNFIGNINIGLGPSSLPLKSLLPHYDAILFAYGASRDKKLGIPGEDLKGVYSARAFVGWYNGLPEYADLAPDLSLGEEAVVIGQGNVALDVTRILLSDIDRLRKTDITEEALDVLAGSRVKRIRVIGRRGPAQASFTIKEIRELLNLHNTTFHPIQDQNYWPSTTPEIKLPRAQKRLLDILEKASTSTSPPSLSTPSWSLEYLLSPFHFTASSPLNPTHISSLTCLENQFHLNPQATDKTTPVPLNRESITQPIQPLSYKHLPAQLAFRSIGYESAPLAGFEDPEVGPVSFDVRKGVIRNDGIGRVYGYDEDGREAERRVPGMYCAGWVKRGPTGVIASTMADAFLTADVIAEDWYDGDVPFLGGKRGERSGWEGLSGEAERLGCRRVSWEDWKRIDGEERRRGKELGKERVKFRRVEDMLAVLD